MCMVTIKYCLYLVVFELLSLLPLRVLYVLSDCLRPIVHHILRYRLDVVRRNLRNSFPAKEYTELRRIESDYYRNLCDNIVETIKLLHISNKEICRRVTVCGTETVERLVREGRPIVTFLGHQGCWEWVPVVTWHLNTLRKNCQIYRPLHDKAFDRIMLKVRSRFGTESIPQRRAFRRMLELRQEYGSFMTGFIADQRPNSSQLNHWTRFLGQDTAVSVGGEEIGRRINAGYVYLDVEKTGRGRYRMTFKNVVPQDDGGGYPYTRGYLSMLEQAIRRQPACWLWSHRRWLYARPEDKKRDGVKLVQK